MSKNRSLSKTCQSCGLEKPLAAFLQIAGPEGTMYGTICASCRSGKFDKAKVKPEPEDRTTSSTGFKIDSKSKQKSDLDKQLFRKETEEKYKEEREKLKSEEGHRVEKTDKRLSSERKHRENFLQNRTFGEKKVGEAAKTAGKDMSAYHQVAAGKENTKQVEASIKEEAKAKGFDPLNMAPSRVGFEMRMQGASFRAWLAANPNVAIAKAFGNDKAEQKPAQEKTDDKKATKEDVKDFIKENLTTSPGSKRGR